MNFTDVYKRQAQFPDGVMERMIDFNPEEETITIPTPQTAGLNAASQVEMLSLIHIFPLHHRSSNRTVLFAIVKRKYHRVRKDSCNRMNGGNRIRRA